MKVVGISEDSFIWINNFLFTISRTEPKFNLQKLIMKNRKEALEKEEYFKILPSAVRFNLRGTYKCGSLFINILIKQIMLEWFT
jgi:hypothetical protein